MVWKCICEWLQPEIASDAAVVEFGAGYCDFINNIKAGRKLAVDMSTAVHESAAPDVEAHVGSCIDCAFLPDAAMDVVFASNLLEHLTVPDGTAALHEAWRILKRGGKLIIIQPNFRYCYRDYFDDYTHVAVYTDASLPDLIKASGFAISRLEPRFMPFSMKGRMPVAPWLIRLYLRSPIRPLAGQMLIVAKKDD